MRRKLVATLLALAVVAAVPSVSNAVVYTYQPTPADLFDLDHYKYYTWGVDWVHTDETIVDAILTIEDIYDWRYEANDILNIHLLDEAALGVTVGHDSQGGGDYFDGMGPKVGSWTDPYGDWAHRETLSWSIKDVGLLTDFQTYASDGRVAFGFDPDCHYWNCGVTLEIITEPVPEPGTLALLGLGLVTGAASYRRKRSKM